MIILIACQTPKEISKEPVIEIKQIETKPIIEEKQPEKVGLMPDRNDTISYFEFLRDSGERFTNIWKEKLMKESGIDEEYFNNHFTLDTFRAAVEAEGPIFSVAYIFKVDWLYFKTYDSARIKDESDQYLNDEQIKENFYVRLKRPIEKIISKEQAEEIVRKECSEGMKIKTLYEGYHNAKFKDGNLILIVWDETRFDENICREAEINIETGEVTDCGEEKACVVSSGPLLP